MKGGGSKHRQGTSQLWQILNMRDIQMIGIENKCDYIKVNNSLSCKRIDTTLREGDMKI